MDLAIPDMDVLENHPRVVVPPVAQFVGIPGPGLPLNVLRADRLRNAETTYLNLREFMYRAFD